MKMRFTFLIVAPALCAASAQYPGEISPTVAKGENYTPVETVSTTDHSRWGSDYATSLDAGKAEESRLRRAAVVTRYESRNAYAAAVDASAKTAAKEQSLYPASIANERLRTRLASITPEWQTYFTERYAAHRDLLKNAGAVAEAERLAKASADANGKLATLQLAASAPARASAMKDSKAGKISKAEALRRLQVISPAHAAVLDAYKSGRMGHEEALAALLQLNNKSQ